MDLISWALVVVVFAPLLSASALGLASLLLDRRPEEKIVFRVSVAGILICLVADLVVIFAAFGTLGPNAARSLVHGEVEFGSWLTVGSYTVPLVALIDRAAMTFALLATFLTAMVAFFSRTYLHRDPGFLRFFALLSLFTSGTQLVAWAGALDVMFAGWELIGWSSALYIGFFCERREPVRSSVRAFATYRLCDAGFLFATVMTHELVGSTKLSALTKTALLDPASTAVIGALFILSAAGKSAQLPFSGWLARAMEGPTPSSALFYGGVSIHAGLYLVLRVAPVVQVSPFVEVFAIVIGITTAIYGTAVARVHADAKGALAHATLAQTGLILAEIAAGFMSLAVAHLVGHAMLRVYQYLRAPNTIHDAHRVGHEPAASFLPFGTTGLERRAYLAALHRLRLDEAIDTAFAPILAVARTLDRIESGLRRAVSIDRDEEAPRLASLARGDGEQR